jgi:hypothetical protein
VKTRSILFNKRGGITFETGNKTPAKADCGKNMQPFECPGRLRPDSPLRDGPVMAVEKIDKLASVCP